MTPAKVDLIIHQGATLNQQFVWKSGGIPVNFSGYTARLQVRKSYSAAEHLVNLTTENGGIILGETDGTITLNLSATDTALLNFGWGVYDLELKIGEVVYRLLMGNCTLSPEATK